MTSLLPIDTLGATIKAHVAAGDKSLGKAEEHYKAAGIYLQDAKTRLFETREMTWPAFLSAHCSVARSRADELIAIAEGKTTLAEVRAKDAAKKRAARAKAKQDLPGRPGKSSAIPQELRKAANDDSDPEAIIIAAWRRLAPARRSALLTMLCAEVAEAA